MSAVLSSLNVVLPIFIIIFLGFYLKRRSIIDENFVSVAMKIVFNISLPSLLFVRVSQSDYSTLMQPKNLVFTVYCFIGILVIYMISQLVSKVWIKDTDKHGAFVQGCFRSNYILIGGAILLNMFGDQATEPLSLSMILVIPTFNILAIWILNENGNHKGMDKIKNGLIKISRNPLILSIIAGIIFARISAPIPEFALKTINMLGNVGTPLGLIGIGSYLDFKDLRSSTPAFISVFLKLVLFPMIGTLGAIYMNFNYVETTTIFMLFGSPAAISSFIMAKAMDNDAKLAANIVILGTFLSMITYVIGLSFITNYFT